MSTGPLSLLAEAFLFSWLLRSVVGFEAGPYVVTVSGYSAPLLPTGGSLALSVRTASSPVPTDVAGNTLSGPSPVAAYSIGE